MKLRKLLLTTLVVVLISTNGYAYDATGIWNYTESNLQNYCDEPYILEQGVTCPPRTDPVCVLD